MSATVTTKVHFEIAGRGRRELRVGIGTKTPVELRGRVPRVSRLMALAIKFDRLLSEGAITDQAELARVGHVTRARVTQIMNLIHLAPDIQQAILFLEPVTAGRDPIVERDLRPIAAEVDWGEQRELWRRCVESRLV